MTYAASLTPDFASIAQELIATRNQENASTFSDGSELIPAEVRSQLQREGGDVFRRPAINGATVDREGLTNNYAVEPNMYFAAFPTPAQARRYAYQGLAAATLVMGLLLTSAIIS